MVQNLNKSKHSVTVSELFTYEIFLSHTIQTEESEKRAFVRTYTMKISN